MTGRADSDRFVALFDRYAPREFGYVRRHLDSEGVAFDGHGKLTVAYCALKHEHGA